MLHLSSYVKHIRWMKKAHRYQIMAYFIHIMYILIYFHNWMPWFLAMACAKELSQWLVSEPISHTYKRIHVQSYHIDNSYLLHCTVYVYGTPKRIFPMGASLRSIKIEETTLKHSSLIYHYGKTVCLLFCNMFFFFFCYYVFHDDWNHYEI